MKKVSMLGLIVFNSTIVSAQGTIVTCESDHDAYKECTAGGSR